ncbi:MAG: hypothetical protein PHG19_02130 [Anaerotignum sp.]|nr:hypothetical protein [Anaerotignum sp.]
MTYFTDSIYEKMMVQKPKYRQEEQPPAPRKQKRKSDDKDKKYRELIIVPKERSVEK